MNCWRGTERILKIGQNLMKLWSYKIWWHYFLWTTLYID